MHSVINTDGFTTRQKWLAYEIMLCESLEEVHELQKIITPDMYQDFNLVIDLVCLEDIDSEIVNESDCPDAAAIIDIIQSGIDSY